MSVHLASTTSVSRLNIHHIPHFSTIKLMLITTLIAPMPIGAMRGSGWGRNNDKYGLREFLAERTITIQDSRSEPHLVDIQVVGTEPWYVTCMASIRSWIHTNVFERPHGIKRHRRGTSSLAAVTGMKSVREASWLRRPFVSLPPASPRLTGSRSRLQLR